MHPTDNPATRIAWKIRDIEHCHLRVIQWILEHCGLHFGQPRILHTVKVMNGAPQKEIAARLQISPASLAMSIKRMQKAGFLETVNVQEEFHAAAVASDQRMLSGFSPAELEKLEAYLERIYQNLKRIEEPDHAE